MIHHDRLSIRAVNGLAFVIGFGNLYGLLFGQRDRVVRLEILDDSLGNQKHGVDNTDREQEVIVDTHQVDPEIANGFRRVPGNAADKGGRNGDSDSGGKEIMAGQGHHLREVRHGAFTSVALPIGVRREACRRVECEMIGQGGEFLGIERQNILEPENGVGEEHAHGAENQQSRGITFPILFFIGLDSEKAIGQLFDRFDDWIEKSFALRVQHPKKVQTERFCDCQERCHIENELKPSRGIHREG